MTREWIKQLLQLHSHQKLQTHLSKRMERASWWCSPCPWCSQASFMSLESRNNQEAHTTYPLLLMLGSSPVGLLWQMIGLCMGGEVDGDWMGDWAEAWFPMHQCSPGKEQGRGKRGQRWWCGKWEWYEGCRGRDINEEQRRESEGGGEEREGVEAEQCYTAHLYFIQGIVREKRLMEV